jgi:hypothetical protein
MKQTTMTSVAACLLVFLAAPYIPNMLLSLVVGNYVGVALLLAANLYLLKVNMTVALAFFLACGGLFLENRKRTLVKVEVAIQRGNTGTNMASVSSLSVNAEDLVEGEVHPEHDEPAGERNTFEPTSEGQSNKFDRVGESIDGKHILDTEESTSGVFR